MDATSNATLKLTWFNQTFLTEEQGGAAENLPAAPGVVGTWIKSFYRATRFISREASILGSAAYSVMPSTPGMKWHISWDWSSKLSILPVMVAILRASMSGEVTSKGRVGQDLAKGRANITRERDDVIGRVSTGIGYADAPACLPHASLLLASLSSPHTRQQETADSKCRRSLTSKRCLAGPGPTLTTTEERPPTTVPKLYCIDRHGRRHLGPMRKAGAEVSLCPTDPRLGGCTLHHRAARGGVLRDTESASR